MSRSCSKSGFPATPNLYGVTGDFLSEVRQGVLGEAVFVGGVFSHYEGGLLVDVDTPDTEALLDFLNAGELIGGVFADTQRQSRLNPSLKFEAVGLEWNGSDFSLNGFRTQCQVETTKGGHTGSVEDTLVTVVFSATFDGGKSWVKCYPQRIARTLSCGCQREVMGLHDSLAHTTASEVVDFIAELWKPETLVELAGDNSHRLYTDTLGINGGSTGYRLVESRSDWADRPMGGRKSRL